MEKGEIEFFGTADLFPVAFESEKNDGFGFVGVLNHL